jgi:hypothetical protein
MAAAEVMTHGRAWPGEDDLQATGIGGVSLVRVVIDIDEVRVVGAWILGTCVD